MNRIRRLMALLCTAVLLGCGVGCAQEESDALHTQFVYGQSELGRDLICHRIGRADAETGLLAIFGVHGFEDAFDRDGEVLALLAEYLMAHYQAHPDELGSFCLYVVPTANPDGLLEGTTTDGFGRCNANGIDINRDFSTNWSKKTLERVRTGERPFSTAEACAIRDLVELVKPDYAMDVHGWCELSFGNGKMIKIINEPFGYELKRLCGDGMVSSWLNTVTEQSIMLELPRNPNKDDYVISTGDKLIEGISAWVEYCDAR